MSKQSIANSFRLFNILKKHTDKNHPITQNSLRELIGKDASEIMGDKGTYARRIREIADSLNRDLDGNYYKEEDWRIVYPGYVSRNEGSKNGKIYYNHVFTDTEIDFLITRIRETANFTSEEKASLERRIIDTLCSKYYQYPEHAFELIIEEKEDLPDSEVIKNISILRDHIKAGHMVEFDVEDADNLRVSPYLIIKKDSFYWLIGNEHIRKPDPEVIGEYTSYTDALTAYRIDRIVNIKTAHTLPTQFVHWSTTHNTLKAESYTRDNHGNRITKARFNKRIKENIEKALILDHFEHRNDIR